MFAVWMNKGHMGSYYKDTLKSVLRYREAIVDWSCVVNEISKCGGFWLHTGFQEKHMNPQFLLSSDLSPDTSSSPVLQTVCAEDNRVTNICRERQTTTLCRRSRWNDQEQVSSLLPAAWELKICPPDPSETQQTKRRAKRERAVKVPNRFPKEILLNSDLVTDEVTAVIIPSLTAWDNLCFDMVHSHVWSSHYKTVNCNHEVISAVKNNTNFVI